MTAAKAAGLAEAAGCAVARNASRKVTVPGFLSVRSLNPMEKAPLPYSPPVPCRASCAQIGAFAERQRKRSGLRNGFDLPDLVKRSRGALSYTGFEDENQEDALCVDPDGSFRIYLSCHSSGLRNSWIIAHELGHLLLHWPLVKDRRPGIGMLAKKRTDPGDRDLRLCEAEADRFAASFLMPEAAFRKAYGEGTAAETFAVTQQAVEARATGLGLTA